MFYRQCSFLLSEYLGLNLLDHRDMYVVHEITVSFSISSSNLETSLCIDWQAMAMVVAQLVACTEALT